MIFFSCVPLNLFLLCSPYSLFLCAPDSLLLCAPDSLLLCAPDSLLLCAPDYSSFVSLSLLYHIRRIELCGEGPAVSPNERVAQSAYLATPQNRY
jgi:hypothetical protein